jgi:hypothetical protein
MPWEAVEFLGLRPEESFRNAPVLDGKGNKKYNSSAGTRTARADFLLETFLICILIN